MMSKIKTVDRQLTEGDEVIWSPTRKAKHCFVCKKSLELNDKIYILLNNNCLARHVCCARLPSVRQPQAVTEEEHIEEARRTRQTIGGAKKQACGGHGYSGGTGFKTID